MVAVLTSCVRGREKRTLPKASAPCRTMLLETPRSERARVLSKGTGAAAAAVFAVMEVWAMTGRGLMAVPRTARRQSGTMLVASLREGVASFDFVASRIAFVIPKNA